MEHRKFIDLSVLLDGYYEFHSDWFDALDKRELEAIDDFFGTLSKPDDVTEWKDSHLSGDPGLERRALEAYIQLLIANGMGSPTL